MICFSFNIGCSESKVIFKRRKKNQTCQIKMFYREQTFAPRVFHSELQQQTSTVNTPWACDKGCAEACAERFSALNTEPHRPIDHLVPGPTRPRPFSVPTHSRWRAVRNLPKKMKFYCKISAEPSPQNLLLCSMLMLSSYRPSPCVSLSLQHFISALK